MHRWKDRDFVPDKIEKKLLLEKNCLRLPEKDFIQGSGSAVAFYNDAVSTGNIQNLKTFLLVIKKR